MSTHELRARVSTFLELARSTLTPHCSFAFHLRMIARTLVTSLSRQAAAPMLAASQQIVAPFLSARRWQSTKIEPDVGAVDVVEDGDGFVSVVLNRPETHNVFSDRVIRRLSDVFNGLREREGERGCSSRFRRCHRLLRHAAARAGSMFAATEQAHMCTHACTRS